MVNVVNIDISQNFWESHPDMIIHPVFKKLHTNDKSKDKNKSSTKMWCIALIYDRSSKYYNFPEVGEDNKIDLVMENYGDSTWYKKNEGEFQELRNTYLKMTETPSMRALRELEEKLVERSDFLRDTKYSIGELNERGQLAGGTADTLDKMFANSQKIYEMVEKVRSLVNQEKAKSTRGGITESLSDKGEI